MILPGNTNTADQQQTASAEAEAETKGPAAPRQALAAQSTSVVPGGAALTSEGLLVELHKVGKDVFGDGLLVWQTLEQDDHLRLAHGVHALCCHIPALPVHVCGEKKWETQKRITTECEEINK